MKEWQLPDYDDTFDHILNAYAEQAAEEMEFLADNSLLSQAWHRTSAGPDFPYPAYGNLGDAEIWKRLDELYLLIEKQADEFNAD